jgi:hypothetical protein
VNWAAFETPNCDASLQTFGAQRSSVIKLSDQPYFHAGGFLICGTAGRLASPEAVTPIAATGRFPGVADKVVYWHIDDIEFVHPSIAPAMIDDHVRELISTLK